MVLDPRGRNGVRLYEPMRFFPYGLIVGADAVGEFAEGTAYFHT
jgi:hypothetical protein